ncbi:hypothetical protein [Methylobacterium radiotolerans]|uniref:hypothetical protein n=1 Tax=Methylobacterium radiotolerans TaxID=31998 RepID=UPI001F2B7E6C|nr:hypothetical protein [Methylobacterium radiotolerans]UIY45826.1 hypothetical protein LZ599_32485 [Methylobacterium radiotolerans]
MTRKTPAYTVAFLARMDAKLCFERRQVRAYFLTENEGLSEKEAWAAADEIEWQLECEACDEHSSAEAAAKARGAKALASRNANKAAAAAKANDLLAQVVATAPRGRRTRPEVRAVREGAGA